MIVLGVVGYCNRAADETNNDVGFEDETRECLRELEVEMDDSGVRHPLVMLPQEKLEMDDA